MSVIDDKINKLLESVKKQQREVAETEKKSKTSWVTTCSYKMREGNIINLHVCKEDGIINAMADLILEKHLKDQAYKALDMDVTLEDHNGFTLDDWKLDFKKRLATLSLKKQKQKLAKAESGLNSILSDDQKRELELSKIMENLDE
jgi:hypothetical protein